MAVVLLLACDNRQAAQLPYSTLWNDSNSYQQVKRTQIAPDSIFNSGWKYSSGAEKGLMVETLPQPDSLVNLPHRVTLPNTALWYLNILSFPEDGVLRVRADDGAQVWLSGKVAERIAGDQFKVYAAPNAVVHIRVLNNAMSGGLKEVSYYTQKRFDTIEADYENQLTEKRQLERRSLLKDNLSTLWVGPWLTQTDSFYTIRAIGDKEPITLHWGLAADKLDSIETKSTKLVSFQVKAVASDWHYKICTVTSCTQVYKVPSQKPAFTFSVWGDSQSGWSNFQKHIQHLQPESDAFTVGVGDLVGEGYQEEEWRTFACLLSEYAANRPAYLVAGNHDYDGYYSDLSPEFYHQYASPDGKPYFSWSYGNCAFLAIDPNAKFPIGFSEEQENWFHQQLQSEAWQRAAWRFVFIHQPPYSQGWAGYQGDAVVRELLEPVMEEARIDLVISGHTHDYERLVKNFGKQRTAFIITGGGGGSLEPEESPQQPRMDTVIKKHHYLRFIVADKELEWRVYDLKNQLIDKQTMLK